MTDEGAKRLKTTDAAVTKTVEEAEKEDAVEPTAITGAWCAD